MIKTQHTHTWNSQGINKNYTYKKVESHWGRHQCQPLPFTAACTCSSASKLKSKSRDGSFLGATTVCWVVGNRAALAVSLFSLTPQRWECWCPDGRQGARRVVPYMRFQSLLFASTSLSVLTQVFSTCPPNLLFVLSLSAHRLHEGCACVLPYSSAIWRYQCKHHFHRKVEAREPEMMEKQAGRKRNGQSISGLRWWRVGSAGILGGFLGLSLTYQKSPEIPRKPGKF